MTYVSAPKPDRASHPQTFHDAATESTTTLGNHNASRTNLNASKTSLGAFRTSFNASRTKLQKHRVSDTTDAEKQSQLTSTSDLAKHVEPTAIDNASTPENEKTMAEAIDDAEHHDHNGDDEAVYPAGIQLFLISIALCLSVFLVALDNTIIATAIPKITDDFQSLNDVGWYASSYLLTTCALQLFFGKMYTFYSIKTVFITSIVIFEVGSAICGASPNSTTLIVGRAIAGVGSAGIFSGALIIIAYSVPLVKRPIYTGIVGAMYGIASIAGPLLGGVFTDKVTWRWCFYINLPFAVPTLGFIIFFFHSPPRKAEAQMTWRERIVQLDLLGTSVFIVDIVVCLLALQWGGSTYAWSNWRVVLCLVLFGLLTIVWLYIQWKAGDNATVPFRIIKQRSVAAAVYFAFTIGGAFFIFIYYVPIWFQAIKGVSAFKSGIMTLPMVLALVIANIASGIGTTAVGWYVPFYYASVVLSAIGAGLLTTFNRDTGAGMWIGYQVIYGLGIGFGMQQALITIQTVLPLKDIPTGTALAMFAQTFGGALFVSVGQNVFTNRLVKGIMADTTGLDPTVFLHAGATNLKNVVPPEQLSNVQRAYNTSLTDTWYIAVAMICLSAIGAAAVEWKSVKGMTPGQVPQVGDEKVAKSDSASEMETGGVHGGEAQIVSQVQDHQGMKSDPVA